MSGALGRIACVALSRVLQHWAIVGYIDEILLCLHIVCGICLFSTVCWTEIEVYIVSIGMSINTNTPTQIGCIIKWYCYKLFKSSSIQ